MSARAVLAVVASLASSALASCTMSKDTKDFAEEAAVNVLTFRQGTVTELRERRGTGPFRDYRVSPDALLTAIEGVLRSKVPAVFPNRRAMEVIAKERSGKDADDDWYAPGWDSAVVVIVHPVPLEPDRSRMEIHAMNRGKFVKGRVDWARDLPPLIDAAVLRQGKPPVVPLR